MKPVEDPFASCLITLSFFTPCQPAEVFDQSRFPVVRSKHQSLGRGDTGQFRELEPENESEGSQPPSSLRHRRSHN